MKTDSDTLDLLQALIRCPSVTPEEAGALDCLQNFLEPSGFVAHRMIFSDDDTPDVDNLFIRFGTAGPHFCFAGHTDVVPPGDLSSWRFPPFDAEISDGTIYGRGACDMKGSVAAFAVAARDFLKQQADGFHGSISMLITGDEEGPSINGTVKVLEWMAASGQVPDHCVVGEPTCTEALGDTIKVGRRGSIHFEITSIGKQGHSAYPHKAFNPISPLARVVDRLASRQLDEGAEHFDPSTLAITTFDVGNPAGNVIPEKAVARFNIRFNTQHSPQTLRALVEAECKAVADDTGADFSISHTHNADCFYTEPGRIVDVAQSAIRSATGKAPALSTSGGTSDARFIKDYCPVIEFGPTNRTIHEVNECLEIDELNRLTTVYRNMLEVYFGSVAR